MMYEMMLEPIRAHNGAMTKYPIIRKSEVGASSMTSNARIPRIVNIIFISSIFIRCKDNNNFLVDKIKTLIYYGK